MVLPTTAGAAIRFGDWTLYPREGELERAGERQRLQDLPLRILLELLERPGQLVTREQLIAKLWPKGVVEFEGGLNTAVSKLRATLGDDADAPRYIETIPRKGYRLVAEVSLATRPADEPLPASPAAAVAHPKRRGSWAIYAVALALLAAGGAALWPSAEAPPAGPLRLAVLPFESLSADPANAFFADGLHEEILATLASRATQLEVISRTTMMTLRDAPKAAPAIAAELGATHLLEGAVRREGDDVRVTVSLIDARSDRQTWTRTFDRQLGNAVTLQADMAQELANQLAVELKQEVAPPQPPTSPVAYDLYLRAKLASQAVNRRSARDQTRQIEQWLSEAIALDPSFGAAYLERARIRIVRYVRNHDLSADNARAAQPDIDAARRLLGDNAEVAALQSRYVSAVLSDARVAATWVESPIVIASRDSAVMQWRAFALCHGGKPEEGLAVYAQVAELDPLNPAVFGGWAMELWSMRRPAEALRAIQAFNGRGVGRIDYGDLEFAFTGRTERLRSEIEASARSADADIQLAATFDLLRFERRFEEMRALVTGAAATTLRQGGFRELQAAAIGDKPIAELRGWSALLIGDAAAAQADGQALLEHAQRESASARDTIYLQVLRAEGHLFMGNRERAISEALAARAAVIVRDRPGSTTRRFISSLAARVLAWAGAHDEAVELLEELATQFAALGPAEIARDPLYALPLAGDARYERLAQTLEADIARNQSIFR
jgi:TolB-like protein/DNA-binding winged helix-turn-helix (wHTH) protein